MIKHLHITNFKAARDLPLCMNSLTVLAGLNGSGKSTVLQSLAILKQSVDVRESPLRLHLRGELVQLGRCEDVHSENAITNDIAFSISTSEGHIRLEGKVKEGADTLPLVAEGTLQPEQLFRDFQLIQADRIVPATHFLQAQTSDQESGWLGCRGEFVVDFLHRQQNVKVSSARLFPRNALNVPDELYNQISPTEGLLDQTVGWLQQLSPGVKLGTELMHLTDAVSLHYSYSGMGLTSESRSYRSTNVGFGLTYSLPVVVACLSASNGALLLLENPEAHLHPQGQAALGKLLAQCAADGVQIIVETHSDHLLNGMRLAVKNNIISPECVTLHYFTRDLENGESSVQSPQILPDGQLTDWPQGFFDQWDRSLDELLD